MNRGNAVRRLVGQAILAAAVLLAGVVFQRHERLYGDPVLFFVLGVVLLNIVGVGFRLAWGDLPSDTTALAGCALCDYWARRGEVVRHADHAVARAVSR